MTTAREVELVLPPGWESLPLDAAILRSQIRSMAEEAGWDSELTAAVETGLSQATVEAVDRGLVFAAALLQPPEENGEMGLAASLFLVVTTPDGASASIPFLAWQAAIELAQREDSVDLLKRPEVLTLAGADAVKIVSLEQIPATGPVGEMNLLAATYLTSFPSTGIVVVLGCRTPCVWLAAEFEELFDAIAGSMRFETSDPDPKWLSDPASGPH